MTRFRPGHNGTKRDMSRYVPRGTMGLDGMSQRGVASETLTTDVPACPTAENRSDEAIDGLASTLQDRTARAAQWRHDQAERAAICAGLDWQDCIRALVKAKRMTPDLAGHMGVTL